MAEAGDLPDEEGRPNPLTDSDISENQLTTNLKQYSAIEELHLQHGKRSEN